MFLRFMAASSRCSASPASSKCSASPACSKCSASTAMASPDPTYDVDLLSSTSCTLEEPAIQEAPPQLGGNQMPFSFQTQFCISSSSIFFSSRSTPRCPEKCNKKKKKKGGDEHHGVLKFMFPSIYSLPAFSEECPVGWVLPACMFPTRPREANQRKIPPIKFKAWGDLHKDLACIHLITT